MKGRVLCKKRNKNLLSCYQVQKIVLEDQAGPSNAYRLHGLNELGTSKPLCFPSPQGEVWTRPYSQGATNSVVYQSNHVSRWCLALLLLLLKCLLQRVAPSC